MNTSSGSAAGTERGGKDTTVNGEGQDRPMVDWVGGFGKAKTPTYLSQFGLQRRKRCPASDQTPKKKKTKTRKKRGKRRKNVVA